MNSDQYGDDEQDNIDYWQRQKRETRTPEELRAALLRAAEQQATQDAPAVDAYWNH